MTIVYHAVELIQTRFTFYRHLPQTQMFLILTKNSDFGLGDSFF